MKMKRKKITKILAALVSLSLVMPVFVQGLDVVKEVRAQETCCQKFDWMCGSWKSEKHPGDEWNECLPKKTGEPGRSKRMGLDNQCNEQTLKAEQDDPACESGVPACDEREYWECYACHKKRKVTVKLEGVECKYKTEEGYDDPSCDFNCPTEAEAPAKSCIEEGKVVAEDGQTYKYCGSQQREIIKRCENGILKLVSAEKSVECKWIEEDGGEGEEEEEEKKPGDIQEGDKEYTTSVIVIVRTRNEEKQVEVVEGPTATIHGKTIKGDKNGRITFSDFKYTIKNGETISEENVSVTHPDFQTEVVGFDLEEKHDGEGKTVVVYMGKAGKEGKTDLVGLGGDCEKNEDCEGYTKPSNVGWEDNILCRENECKNYLYDVVGECDGVIREDDSGFHYCSRPFWGEGKGNPCCRKSEYDRDKCETFCKSDTSGTEEKEEDVTFNIYVYRADTDGYLSGANVLISQLGTSECDGEKKTTWVDESGATFTLPEGCCENLDLKVTKEGYKVYEKPGINTCFELFEVGLTKEEEEGIIFKVNISNLVNDKVVPDAKCSIWRTGKPDVCYQEVSSDKNGIATFTVPEECCENMSLRVYGLKEYDHFLEESIEDLCNGEEIDKSLTPKEATINMKVFKFDSNEIIPGATLEISSNNSNCNITNDAHDDGRMIFTIPGECCDENTMFIMSKNGYVSNEISSKNACESKDTLKVFLESDSTVKVEGKVEEGKGGRQEGFLFISPVFAKENSFTKLVFINEAGKKWETETDEDGHYELELPANDSFTVEVIKSGAKKIKTTLKTKQGENYVLDFKTEEGAIEQIGGEVDLQVISVESEPQMIDETYYLNQGWNLITLGVDIKDMQASDLLNKINEQEGESFSLARFVNNRWQTYILDLNKDDDFILDPGKAYLVKSEKGSFFKLEGKEFEKSVKLDLKPGWNSIGMPMMKKEYTGEDVLKDISEADSFASYTSGLWETVTKEFVPEEEKTEIFGRNFKVERLRGYFLKMKQETSFTP